MSGNRKSAIRGVHRWLVASTLASVLWTMGRGEEIRIGLVGLDTSHVAAFLTLFNDPRSSEHVPGARIVAAFKGGSPDMTLSQARLERFTHLAVDVFGVELCASIGELARKVDAIMILSVDGRAHLDQFRQTLAAGRPVFIDKPMGGSLADAVEIARLAEAARVPCFGTSSLRYPLDSPLQDAARIGDVAAVFSYGPAEFEPHMPDLFWYGIHTVEALYAVMGPGCVSVVRTHTENTDVITGVWSDARVGTVQGNRNGHPGFGITVFGSKGVVTGGQKSSYRPLAEELVKFFRTGVAPVPLATTVEIHAFMEAADNSRRRDSARISLAEVMGETLAGRVWVDPGMAHRSPGKKESSP